MPDPPPVTTAATVASRSQPSHFCQTIVKEAEARADLTNFALDIEKIACPEVFVTVVSVCYHVQYALNLTQSIGRHRVGCVGKRSSCGLPRISPTTMLSVRGGQIAGSAQESEEIAD